MAPDFLLEDLDGGEVRLSDLRGQPVVINFWATWCAPCRKEMPQFVAAYDGYKDEGLEVVAVNVQESPSIIRPFAEDFGMELTVVLDKRGAVSDVNAGICVVPGVEGGMSNTYAPSHSTVRPSSSLISCSCRFSPGRGPATTIRP